MLKNKIPLHAFVALNLLTLGILGLSIAYRLFTLLEKRNHRWRLSDDEIFGVILPAIFGVLLVFSGLGLLLKMKWARISVNFILFIFFMLTAVISTIIFYNNSGAPNLDSILPMISILLFILCFLLSLFFFINNERVVKGMKYPKASKSSKKANQ